MTPDQTLELMKWLGIAWGMIIGAAVVAISWINILPKKWAEQSAGKTAIDKLDSRLEGLEDDVKRGIKELREDQRVQREENAKNWIEFYRLQQQQNG